jgi:hypothetical protein
VPRQRDHRVAWTRGRRQDFNLTAVCWEGATCGLLKQREEAHPLKHMQVYEVQLAEARVTSVEVV